MLTLLQFSCVASLIFLFRFSNADCTTSPFCDAYPECSRYCLGAQLGNSDSFFHSYGFDMMKICSTGDSSGGSLGDHYSSIFVCIDKNCTASTDRQATWNQLVDDCGAKGFTVDSRLKPAGYSVHVPKTVATISATSTSGSNEPPRPTTTAISTSPSETPPTSSSVPSGSPRTTPIASSDDSGGLPPLVIAAIAIGSLFVAILTLFATVCVGWLQPRQFFWCITCGKKGRRHKENRRNEANEPRV